MISPGEISIKPLLLDRYDDLAPLATLERSKRLVWRAGIELKILKVQFASLSHTHQKKS